MMASRPAAAGVVWGGVLLWLTTAAGCWAAASVEPALVPLDNALHVTGSIFAEYIEVGRGVRVRGCSGVGPVRMCW